MSVKMEFDIKEILFPEKEIRAKILEMGALISSDYKGKNLHLVGILKGSVVFMSDLIRSIDIPLTIDFMGVSSYGDAAKSTGVVKITKDLDLDLSGKDILLIEDILDSGTTLSYILNLLQNRNPRSLEVAALLDKPENRKTEVRARYKGFLCPPEFVVGYGLDYSEKYRNLPYIGALKREIYT